MCELCKCAVQWRGWWPGWLCPHLHPLAAIGGAPSPCGYKQTGPRRVLQSSGLNLQGGGSTSSIQNPRSLHSHACQRPRRGPFFDT